VARAGTAAGGSGGRPGEQRRPQRKLSAGIYNGITYSEPKGVNIHFSPGHGRRGDHWRQPRSSGTFAW
jgi:hypothetical protein